LATLTVSLQNVYADTVKTAQAPAITQQNAQTQRTWLGVALSNVPEVLSRQLGNVIPERQGVMVQSVSPSSPAQKAGIQPFDIILSYGDQQIYSVEQLVSLVASDVADKDVTLGVVRNGTKEDIKVTLGTRSLPTAPMVRPRHPMFGFNRQPMMPRLPRVMPDFRMPPLSAPSEKTHVMQQFESIQVRTLDGDRYHAEVEYQENGGEKKQFVFEGKYDEVLEQIKNNKELPESKKNSLLNALKNNPAWLIPDDFMDFPPMPSFDRYFDNTPSWFRNGNRL
jgi:membrane-associated protease RseP (regulator of RpoE activity)